jgi:hypothetical protein
MSARSERVVIGLALLVTVLGVVAAATTYKLKANVARLQSELAAGQERERVLDQQVTRERTDRMEAGAALRRERTARSTRELPHAVTLRPGPPAPNTRSPELTIEPDQDLVVLDLAVPATLTGRAFRAGLRSAPGDEFWMQSRLAVEPDRRAVRVQIPADMLRAADYELSLHAISGAGRLSDPVFYYFAVRNSP